MLAALAILPGADEEQVFGQSLKQKEYCICLRVGLTRLSLGLWGLVVFQPHLEYLGAVLGAWRHEEERIVPWVLCLDHTCSQLPARSTARGRHRGLQCG